MPRTHGGSTGHDEAVSDLIMSILAVNFWTLEKVYALQSGLEEQGLFDMKGVAALSPQEVTEKLVAAGYTRGGFPVPMMANRLVSTARTLAAGGEEKLTTLLAAGAGKELDEFLVTLKGVGPTVLSNFKVLQEIAG